MEQTPPVVDTSQPATEPVKAAPAEEDEVTRLLAAAEADIKARRLTRPVGNNAWDRYLRVLELEPASPAAIRGMERVIESYGGLFDAALGQEDYDKAAGYLSSIGDLNPDSPVFEEGERRLEAARQARAARLAEIARQAELERQRIAQAIETHWSAFDSALQADDLDEATNSLTQVRALSPEAPGLAAGEQRLAAAQVALERQRQVALERELTGDMVSIPGGMFRMGDLNGGGDDDERPVHSVTVPAFMLGKFEVTFTQWDACVADGGCGRYTPDDEGWGRGNRIGSNRANCYEDNCGDRWKYTAPVGSFSANAWGLHDLHGNVWEWAQDCWNDSYVGAPTDGSAWTSGDCGRRVIRGGSWDNDPRYLRSASRYRNTRSDRDNDIGFRLAQDK